MKNRKKESAAEIVTFLKANGAGSVVTRRDVAKVSCGFLHPRTLANDDSAGEGPEKRVLFGARGKIAYPVESLAKYMAKRGFRIESRKAS